MLCFLCMIMPSNIIQMSTVTIFSSSNLVSKKSTQGPTHLYYLMYLPLLFDVSHHIRWIFQISEVFNGLKSLLFQFQILENWDRLKWVKSLWKEWRQNMFVQTSLFLEKSTYSGNAWKVSTMIIIDTVQIWQKRKSLPLMEGILSNHHRFSMNLTWLTSLFCTVRGTSIMLL